MHLMWSLKVSQGAAEVGETQPSASLLPSGCVPPFCWRKAQLGCPSQVDSEFLLCCGTTLTNNLDTMEGSQSRSFPNGLFYPAW